MSQVHDPRALGALARFDDVPANFEVERIEELERTPGWTVTRWCVDLPSEAPGGPEEDGPWAIACDIVRRYEFADPSIIEAVYRAEDPLERRTMMLVGKFYGLRFHLGVRVARLTDATITEDGRDVRVWGWAYSTLQGHLERGQMDFLVRKDLASGAVAFEMRAVWSPAVIPNPIIRLGFALFGKPMQRRFVRRSQQRMVAMVDDELLRRRAGVRVPAAETVDVREVPPEELP